MTDKARATIERIVAERGIPLSAMSHAIGRNSAYLQQFLRRGTPKTLPEDERLALAMFLVIDERELGAREPYRP